MDIRGRHVVLTGATGGIGALLAERLVAGGARLTLIARGVPDLVALADRHSANQSDDANHANHANGAHRLHSAQLFPADLTDAVQLADLTSRLEFRYGPVDVLINNAGLESGGYLPEQTGAAVRSVLALNLLAPVELTRQVLPGMLTRGRGHIVNISSLAAVAPFPGLAVYAASKAGLSQFTAGLRSDLGRSPVRTTLVEIGPVATSMLVRAHAYPPTRRSFERMARWQLLPTLTGERVADQIVAAIVQDRRSVRLPRRTALAPIWAQLPRTVVAAVLTGIRAEPGPQAAGAANTSAADAG